MNIVRLIMSGIPLAFGYFCLATVAVQVGFGAMMWSKDKLTQDKIMRYTAIAYGLDLADLPTMKPTEPGTDVSDEELTHEQLLTKRVNANDILADRIVAMKQEAAKIRSLEKELKAERNRRALVRSNFRGFLNELEQKVVIDSLGDVQRTLETLAPRQRSLKRTRESWKLQWSATNIGFGIKLF
jgi:predicted DNA-binding transcriptional regulator